MTPDELTTVTTSEPLLSHDEANGLRVPHPAERYLVRLLIRQF